MRSYEAARGLFSLLGFVAWCQIFGGGFIVVAAVELASEVRSFSGPPSITTLSIAAVPGVLICLSGLFGLAMVQNGRATVDMAELTQQMLKVARDQLEVSQQALRKSNSITQSFEAVAATSEKAGGGRYQSDHALGQTDTPPNNAPSISQTSGLKRIGPNLLSYEGQSIAKVGGNYLVDGVPFASLDDARRYILKNPIEES